MSSIAYMPIPILKRHCTDVSTDNIEPSPTPTSEEPEINKEMLDVMLNDQILLEKIIQSYKKYI